jgi:P-type E1-E2 ATPase
MTRATHSSWAPSTRRSGARSSFVPPSAPWPLPSSLGYAPAAQKHLAIVSGDNERPTRKLAERLGIDRHFAEVLPEDKARYVELLQKERRTVCFIGDGVNDSIALKKAKVSISLRGASSIATDTAQVVFMEDSLLELLQLHDISSDLQRNINTPGR